MRRNPCNNTPADGKVPRHEDAFTLTDLLVMIATVCVLAVMCLSALATTRPNTQAFQCLNNLKQMMRAFRMYADDNGDVMVAAVSGNGSSYNGRPNWIQGSLSFTTSQINWDAASPSSFIVRSPLWPYIKQATIFRCPADPVLITVTAPPAGFTNGQYPRIRSISLSQVFGNGDWQPASEFKLYGIYSTIDMPSQTITFLDEHPNSINDGAWAWSDDPQAVVDEPASFHERAAGITFADGHAIDHRWRGTLVSPPYLSPGVPSFGIGRKSPVTADDVADVAWVSANNTVHQ